MTIAACYVSNEGVVLGADSTTTYPTANGARFFNNAQKIFEVGESGSTLGIVTWGMGGLPQNSYRQLAAELSDDLLESHPGSVQECAQRWSELFWNAYSGQCAPAITKYNALRANPARNPLEELQLKALDENLAVGFCIGGHVENLRDPMAFELAFKPDLTGAPSPIEVLRDKPAFWGVRNVMNRLLKGIDQDAFAALLASGGWKGTQADLENVLRPFEMGVGHRLPLRDAVDWIYSSIFTTIKSLKFSGIPMVCGGPIEIGAITADRKFRWICHKGLDQALSDHLARGNC